MALDYNALAKEVADNEGFSVNARGRAPSGGFMVSRAGSEKVVPGKAAAGDIEEYATAPETQSFLAAGRRSRAHVGAWLEDAGTPHEQTVLDLSQNFPTKQSADLQAAIHGQRAIFDVSADWDSPDKFPEPSIRGGMSDAELSERGLAGTGERRQTLPWSADDFDRLDVKEFPSAQRNRRTNITGELDRRRRAAAASTLPMF